MPKTVYGDTKQSPLEEICLRNIVWLLLPSFFEPTAGDSQGYLLRRKVGVPIKGVVVATPLPPATSELDCLLTSYHTFSLMEAAE